jgi:hypothetical protein
MSEAHELPLLLRIGALEYLRSLGDQVDELAAKLCVSAFGMLVFRQVAAQLARTFLRGEGRKYRHPVSIERMWAEFEQNTSRLIGMEVSCRIG